MDIIGGLTAAKLAIDLVKDLRSIDRSVDEATFKLKLADLTVALADAKLSLSDAKTSLDEMTSRIRNLTDGTLCPMCRLGRLKVTSIEEHDFSNTQFHKVECDTQDCSYTATRTYDPTRSVYSERNG